MGIIITDNYNIIYNADKIECIKEELFWHSCESGQTLGRDH